MGDLMTTRMRVFVFLALLACGSTALPQTRAPERTRVMAKSAPAKTQNFDKPAATLDAQREKVALQVFLRTVQTHVVSAAEAMPADKYNFAPTEGEFKGVRTFGQQVKHLAATNHILAAAALGEDPPSDAGDEQGPENVRTKAEILEYLNSSIAHLARAIDAVGDNAVPVKASPISPFSAARVTRSALTVEAMIHAFDHYGQMVVYLRMSGVVPPASRP
jgi:uncharacterized damage-inducible protein DinB